MNTIVVGLGMGDEGKGALSDFLVRQETRAVVVRYNGGSQAAHHVVTPEGVTHCFSQFGSGTLANQTETCISKYMLVELECLEEEARVLRRKNVKNPLSRMVIDPEASLIIPAHKLVGQLLELARQAAGALPGSCGKGVGQAVRWREQGLSVSVEDVRSGRAVSGMRRLIEYGRSQALRLLTQVQTPEAQAIFDYFAAERSEPDVLAERYAQILSGGRVLPAVEYLTQHVRQGSALVFEGAQGTLLDRERGFTPHVTPSRTTHHQATGLAHEIMATTKLKIPLRKLGILRAYAQRHGRGPLVTEDMDLACRLHEVHNGFNRWQGRFRVGWLDLVALRYALELNAGVDALALTCVDQLTGLGPVRVCVAYEYQGDSSELDENFLTERWVDGRTLIHAIRVNPMPAPVGALSRILERCRPVYRTFRGWTHSRDARPFIRFLESRDGLGTPVAILSTHPSASGKIFLSHL